MNKRRLVALGVGVLMLAILPVAASAASNSEHTVATRPESATVEIDATPIAASTRTSTVPENLVRGLGVAAVAGAAISISLRRQGLEESRARA